MPMSYELAALFSLTEQSKIEVRKLPTKIIVVLLEIK